LKKPNSQRAQREKPELEKPNSQKAQREELEKPKSQKAQKQCIICMDAPTEAVIIPCGHLAMCLKDAKKLNKCPICRAPYTLSQIIKVFHSGIDNDE